MIATQLSYCYGVVIQSLSQKSDYRTLLPHFLFDLVLCILQFSKDSCFTTHKRTFIVFVTKEANVFNLVRVVLVYCLIT